jgi:hypothetical protein
MNDAIKIWKSNLQGVLEEVVGPVYLFGASATSNGQIPMTAFYVSVAGFNNEGNVCELRIPQPSVPALLGDERVKAYKENQRVLDEVRERLNGVEREVRDGVIGRELVAGTL